MPHYYIEMELILEQFQIDTTEIYTHLHDQEVMDAMLDHPLSQF